MTEQDPEAAEGPDPAPEAPLGGARRGDGAAVAAEASSAALACERRDATGGGSGAGA